ncbi:MAG: FkbM family methyltransferase [Acidimicrobiales bacterium]
MTRPATRPATQPATRTVTCTLFDGQRLTVVRPEIVGDALCRDGRIEPALTRVLLDHLRPGDVFVDVGAQYGYFTVLAARAVGPTGRVVAFEPGRRTLPLLARNVAGRANVVVEPCAVHAGPGTAELHDFGPEYSALNTVLAGARVPAHERARLRAHTYPVPTVALDGYCATHDLHPDMVKIDAEGAETSILRGMARILREGAPLVAVEAGDYEGMASPPTAESIDLMEAMGYRCFDHDGRGMRPHERRRTYGYGNLFFLKDPGTGGRPGPRSG